MMEQNVLRITAMERDDNPYYLTHATPREEFGILNHFEIKTNEWVSYLEKNILKEYIKHIQTKGSKPTYILMTPSDTHKLMRDTYQSRYQVSNGFDGSFRWRDMIIMRTLDLVEGEIKVI